MRRIKPAFAVIVFGCVVIRLAMAQVGKKGAVTSKQEPIEDNIIQEQQIISSLEAAAREREADRVRLQAEEARRAETAFWESIKNSTNIEDFKAYLNKYPGGQFAALANSKVETFYQKVFSPKDVTKKVRITSRPEPAIYPGRTKELGAWHRRAEGSFFI